MDLHPPAPPAPSAAAVARLCGRIPGLLGDLRSDHAGETGAVMIYRGILAFARDPALRDFAARHGETEAGHLRLLEAMLPPAGHSRLLPIWRVAGWLTGALPALVGPAAVQVTIEAVESFVDRHYREQIETLGTTGEEGALRALLEHCRLEEVEHRDEAAGLLGPRRGLAARLWGGLVGWGSASAVKAARRV